MLMMGALLTSGALELAHYLSRNLRGASRILFSVWVGLSDGVREMNKTRFKRVIF